MIKVICVDDSSRPADIPLSLWVKREISYSVIEVLKDMHGIEYYKLEELDLSAAGTLYKGYAASRFKIAEDSGGVELVEELKLEMV